MVCWRPSITSEDVIMHSSKGSTWKNHKYIRKEGNRYIYKESKGSSKSNNAKSTVYNDEDVVYYDDRGAITMDKTKATKAVHPDGSTEKVNKNGVDLDTVNNTIKTIHDIRHPETRLVGKLLEAGRYVYKTSKVKAAEKDPKPKHGGGGGNFDSVKKPEKTKTFNDIVDAKKAKVATNAAQEAGKRRTTDTARSGRQRKVNTELQNEKKKAVKRKIEEKNRKSTPILEQKKKEKDNRDFRLYRTLLKNYRRKMADYKSRPTR